MNRNNKKKKHLSKNHSSRLKLIVNFRKSSKHLCIQISNSIKKSLLSFLEGFLCTLFSKRNVPVAYDFPDYSFFLPCCTKQVPSPSDTLLSLSPWLLPTFYCYAQEPGKEENVTDIWSQEGPGGAGWPNEGVENESRRWNARGYTSHGAMGKEKVVSGQYKRTSLWLLQSVSFLVYAGQKKNNARRAQYVVSQALSLVLPDWIQTQSREEVLG